MSADRSDSSESTSIYETPINSPLNQSLVDSTRIDSSLFDMTSANTQSIDSQTLESRPMSVNTESTLRQSVREMTGSATNDQPISASMADSSIWLRRHTLSDAGSQWSDSNRTDKYCLLSKYMSELDCEHLELIGVEQQIQAIGLKCRTIRANLISKTNAINAIINEIVVNQKERVQKQTQTDSDCDNSKSVYNVVESYPFSTSVEPNVSLHLTRETQTCIESQSSPKSDIEFKTLDDKCSELLDPIKTSLARLPALVKGYLTRRLMKTEKVMNNIETIRDTTQLLTNYHNTRPEKKITLEDINFHRRLIIQLEKCCHELYDIFFNYPKSAQMALISRSREHILERHFRTGSVLSNSSYLTTNPILYNSQTNGLSSVTKKVIQRKTQKSRTNISQQNSSHSNSNSNSTLNKDLTARTPKPSNRQTVPLIWDLNNRTSGPIPVSSKSRQKYSSKSKKKSIR